MKDILTAGRYYLEIGCALFPTTQHKIEISNEDYNSLKEKYIKNEECLPEKLPIAKRGDKLVWNDVIRTMNNLIDYLEKKDNSKKQDKKHLNFVNNN